MDTRRPVFKILATGVAYGLGLLLGNAISHFIFQNVSPERFLTGSQAVRLALGVLLAFAISGVGGLVGGMLGGAMLPRIGREKSRWRFILASGIIFGVGYGLLLFPLILISSLLSFYDITETPVYVFSAVFGIVGLIFGALVGLFLGMWTVGRRFPPVTWSSAAGFAVGGALLGAGVWRQIFTVTAGTVESGDWGVLLLGLFAFGAAGGIGLGIAYHRALAASDDLLAPVRKLTREALRRRWVIVGLVLIAIVLLFRPVAAAVGDLLTPIDAGLSSVLDLETTGTHWLDGERISVSADAVPTGLALAAHGNGRLALVWVDNSGLQLSAGDWSAADRRTEWETPAGGSGISAAPSEPAVTLDANGRYHLAWVENGVIFATSCGDAGCAPVQTIAPPAACGATPARAPTLGVSGDSVLLVWSNAAGLPYATWSSDASAPRTAAGCVPEASGATGPQLASGVDGGITLIFADVDGEIVTAVFGADAWSDREVLGNGRAPAITLDSQGAPHAAWCGPAGEVVYWHAGQTETVAAETCASRPALAHDGTNQAHVVWHGDAVRNSAGTVAAASVIYESLRTDAGWTAPAIVGAAAAAARPTMLALPDGSLHLAWADGAALAYAAQVQYACPDGADLDAYGKLLYEVARDPAYTPPDDPVPYCQNRVDRLIFAPNPDPAFSDQTPTPNGPFDVLADLIRSAEYEVLFSTMWYDAAENNDSPGSVIATAVADLYASVRANPERYPRGMTVRILLDNPPELALGETTGQLWTLLSDLRAAGIDRMVDEEIGWRLQVADYEGQMPHSHVKTVVIDGKTAVAAGFNMTYDHLPKDHVSGKGNGRFDLALQISGPAAQSALRAFDDMWNGADERYCLTLDPPLGVPWQVACFDSSAAVEHVPEVLKFYLPPGGTDPVFPLYRSKAYNQADQQAVAVLAAANDFVDIFHVNFSLDLICNLNILFEVCDVDVSPDYMQALLQAAENGAHVRVLVKPGPVEGIENVVAINSLEKRLAELGLTNRVEVRFLPDPMHPKALLVDDAVLIVGSQNFHYSAFGEGGGLNEFSFAVEKPEVLQEYRRAFDHLWEGSSEQP